MLTILGILFAAFCYLSLYALCVSSGKADDMTRQMILAPVMWVL